MVLSTHAVPISDHHMMIATVVGQQNVHPLLVSPGDVREFLDYSTGQNVVGVSKSLGLSIAFGIAGSVLFGAIGAAFKYVSDKVEEQRNSKI